MATVLSFALALFIATGFVSWTIIASYSKVAGGWVGVIVAAATSVMLGLCSTREIMNTPPPSGKALQILVVAGLVNGLAVYLYAQRIANPNVTTFVVTVSVLMVVCTPAIDWLINGNGLTGRQMIGFTLAAASIYLIKL